MATGGGAVGSRGRGVTRDTSTERRFATGLLQIVAVTAILPLSLFAHAVVGALTPQPAGAPEIWKGLFTDAQVERGRAVFQGHCATCHDPREQGEAPLLSGDVFMRNWEGHTVGRLYTKIVEEMPANNAASVSAAQKRDAVAFILHENGFPSGPAELPAEAEALVRIQIVPESGVAAPRAGAMVVVVGCLVRAAPNEWRLTNSTEPAATTLARTRPVTSEPA